MRGLVLWMSVDTETMLIAGKYSILNTEHDRQCTCNVTLRDDHVTVVLHCTSSKFYICCLSERL
jgi:hypothetical protein